MRHKVFISYHHANDQYYKNKFEELFANQYDIMVTKSVQIGDINPSLKTETIRQKIRDEYLRDSTVTIVLIGSETWKRKHVDWEIASSIRQTIYNPRSGLLGIILPSYHEYYKIEYGKYNKFTIPPRLSKNIDCSFAEIYEWSDDPYEIQTWIHEAFNKRTTIIPDNSYPSFINNKNGTKWQ